MGDFLERLRKARQAAEQQRERREQDAAEEAARLRKTAELVDRAADEIEEAIELRLKQFQGEFVEFRYDAFTRDGRHLRLYWDEPIVKPDGKPDKLFHQLLFQVQRHHDYADVEVIAKAIVRNSDRRLRARQEDVYEGDPGKLLPFVEQELLAFTRLYTNPPDDN